jgi:hypothetical protein
MEVHREGGVLVSLLGCIGWVYGRILGGVGKRFVVTPDLKWEIALRFNSGMIFGVGIWPLWMHFQFYLILLAQRMLKFNLASAPEILFLIFEYKRFSVKGMYRVG